jgi:hypothetical protein
MTPEQYKAALEYAEAGAVNMGLAVREFSGPDSPLPPFALASLERVAADAKELAALLEKLQPPEPA